MKAFHNGRDAKEFLISRIVAEAQHENAPLSEVERKVLYFTESGWTLPDMMEVSETFDREYEQSKYEKRIAKLIRNAAKHDRRESQDEYDSWWPAIRFLDREDHYISVMIRIAGLRPAGDQLKLFGTALIIVSCILFGIFFSIKYNIHLPGYVPSRSARSLYFWVSCVSAALSYSLFRFIVGNRRVDKLTSKVLEKLARIGR